MVKVWGRPFLYFNMTMHLCTKLGPKKKMSAVLRFLLHVHVAHQQMAAALHLGFYI